MTEKDDWQPDQAELRDGETPDIDAHTRRNIEQLRQFASKDIIDQETATQRIAELKHDD